jgi:hypothetical protein
MRPQRVPPPGQGDIQALGGQFTLQRLAFEAPAHARFEGCFK